MRLHFDGLKASNGIAVAVRVLLSDSSKTRQRRTLDLASMLRLTRDRGDLFDDGRELESWTHGVDSLRALLTSLARAEDRIALDECSYIAGVDGMLGVAAHLQEDTLEVAPDDAVSAGFAALWSPTGGIRVWPRIYRLVCANGQVGRLGSRREIITQPHQIEAEVRACLTGEEFAESVKALRVAASFPATDPVDALTAIEDEAFKHRVIARFSEDADRSQWSLSNAVTAEARFEENPSVRFDYERIGARLAFEPWQLGRGALRSERVHRSRRPPRTSESAACV